MSIEKAPVVVIGAGPAGLAVSHELQGAGIDHIVLERGRKHEELGVSGRAGATGGTASAW